MKRGKTTLKQISNTEGAAAVGGKIILGESLWLKIRRKGIFQDMGARLRFS